jgi:uncharacterized protein YcfJ
MTALIAVLVVSIAFIPGCGPHVGKKTVVVKNYGQCYAPLDALRESADKIKSDTIKGAAAGAAAGAIVGLLSRGDLKGALVGAVIGAGMGAISANLISKANQAKALDERFASYNTAMDKALTDLNMATKAAAESCKCYNTEYNKLNAGYKKKKTVTPEERADYLERLTEIRAGNADAIGILDYYKVASAENQTTFAEVVRLENTRESDQAPQKTIRTVEQKRKTYDTSVNNMEKTLNLAKKNQQSYDSDYEMTINQARNPVPKNILATTGINIQGKI